MLRRLLGRAVLAGLVVAALVGVGRAPAADGQEVARTFVGRVVGGEAINALVAVVVAPDNTAIAYLCSNDDAWNQQYSKWFSGEMDTQGKLLARANDGTELLGTEAGQWMEGTAGGLQWTAELALRPAGLYRGQAADQIHGVIQAPDGTRVGRAWTVTTGAHAGTWDFASAVVEQHPGALHARRNVPEFIFVELRVCLDAFCGD